MTPAVTSVSPSAFWQCKKLPAGFMASNTLKEVGVGAFARSGIISTNFLPYVTQDIYTFVGGKGEALPYDVATVVIDKSVDEIEHGHI
eukprot:CAMPEP_0171306394 /NCGR_PEP_ID=MMETSP0816-20121228/16400_1 /TAXON_ID=420281 /ORGANISM="Proboscia inermis, Strain CCAP1064/1" /LENGTH=87 /DNA_ID=CAMNT_0011787949 /DNA_START=828 /DNA_END=1091 /DNA_ORIENTATION=+